MAHVVTQDQAVETILLSCLDVDNGPFHHRSITQELRGCFGIKNGP